MSRTLARTGSTPSQTIAGIRRRVLELGERLSDCFDGELRPALARHGVRVVGYEELDEAQRAYVAERFEKVIFPALTPLAVAPGRPFPYISNLSLSLAVLVRDPLSDQTVFARVKVPTEILPRFMAVRLDAAANSSAGTTLVPLEDIIAHHLDQLFPGMEIVDCDVFRVTRDADLEVSDDAADLLQAVEDELRRRRFGEVVRVELGSECTPQLRAELAALLEMEDEAIYPVKGLLGHGLVVADLPPAGHEGAARPADGGHHPPAPFAPRGRATRRAGGDARRRPAGAPPV